MFLIRKGKHYPMADFLQPSESPTSQILQGIELAYSTEVIPILISDTLYEVLY